MKQAVTEAALADIMSVPKTVVGRWREMGKVTPQADGKYDLAAHTHLPPVEAMLTSTWREDIEQPARDYSCVELFAGAGGMALGLEAAGFESECLYELDRDACNTLRRNRPYWNVYEGDVSDVDFTRHRGIDVVAGGFPCQAFSDAGKRMGFHDTRGTLFYEFARAIKEARPRVFVGENVRGLITHDKGRTLGTIKQVLTELGYALIEPEVLKGIFHRVPQKRERLFLIGVRNDLTGTFKWPSPCHRIFTLRDALHAGELYPTNCPKSFGVSYPPKRAAILKLIPPGGWWVDLPEELQRSYLGRSIDTAGGMTSTARRLSWDEPSLTLVCSPSQKQTERCHPDETRPLTLREYARIQTFPDDWGFSGTVRSRYKQIGNAVPCNLAEAVGHSVIALLNSMEP